MQKGVVSTTVCGVDLSSFPSPRTKPSGPVAGTKTSPFAQLGTQAPFSQRSRLVQPSRRLAAALALAVGAAVPAVVGAAAGSTLGGGGSGGDPSSQAASATMRERLQR